MLAVAIVSSTFSAAFLRSDNNSVPFDVNANPSYNSDDATVSTFALSATTL